MLSPLFHNFLSGSSANANECCSPVPYTIHSRLLFLHAERVHVFNNSCCYHVYLPCYCVETLCYSVSLTCYCVETLCFTPYLPGFCVKTLYNLSICKYIVSKHYAILPIYNVIEFLIVLFSPDRRKWHSKTMFQAMFDRRSSIVKNIFDCRLSGKLHRSRR